MIKTAERKPRFCACQSNTGASETEAPKVETAKKTIRVSIVENEEHPQGLLIKTFKDELEKLSGGNIEVQLFYNSSLYTQEAAMQALNTGDLEMTMTSMQVTEEYLPSINMFTSTFFFKDYAHMRTVLDGEIGQKLFDDMHNSVSYVPVGFFYNGSRQLNLRTDDPITKPEQLSSTILRMPSSDAWIAAGESLGAKATPLAYAEVYGALQNGTIDAQDNPLPSVKSAKFYEVTKQISLTYHIIDAEIVALNTKFWDGLTAEEQGWIKDATKAAIKVCDEAVIKQESELLSFFESEGLTIVEPDHEAFAAYAKNYYEEKGLTEKWDMDLYDKVQSMAK